MRLPKLILFFTALILPFCFGLTVLGESPHQKQFVYDYANLLTDKEKVELETLAQQLGVERATAFIIVTVNGTSGRDIIQFVGDFYDEEAPGFDKPHGNAAILAIDLKERDVYLAGFQKAEKYLDDRRLDKVRQKVTPDLSSGNYFKAFSTFITTSHHYMGFEPGVNPENMLFKWWFQLIVSVVVAAIIVFLMVYRSGGRVTVNARTYIDSVNSKVVSEHDKYVRETVTKVKKPTNNNKGGGGGGFTGRGFSHSGSKGKF